MKEEYGYPNDEELEAMIAEVEQKAMIAPPVYLKDQIMDEIRKAAEPAAIVTYPHETGIIKKTENKKRVIISQKERERREKKARVQFMLYSAKIIAAAAAAVMCLAVVPMDAGRAMVISPDDSLETRISKDVEKYKEEQQRIEKELEEEIQNGQGSISGENKDNKNQNGGGDKGAKKRELIKDKLEIEKSGNVSQIINSISTLFGTEE